MMAAKKHRRCAPTDGGPGLLGGTGIFSGLNTVLLAGAMEAAAAVVVSGRCLPGSLA